MPRRIEEDHKNFRDIVSGKIRKQLKEYLQTGNIFRGRGTNGKITLSIPKMDIPQFIFGEEPTWTIKKKRKKIWRDISAPWEVSSQEN